MVSGEIWRAVADGEPVEPGAQVQIIAVEGLTLKVAKAAQASQAEAKGGVA
jgi:membrane-bound ClpP family serine protease